MAETTHTNHEPIASVDEVYASALLDMAQEQDVALEVLEEAADLAELIRRQPGLRMLIGSGALSRSDRAGSLERLFKGRVSDLLFRFLMVVNGKDRLGELPGILRAVQKLYEQRQGIVEVEAHVAQTLPADQVERVARRLGELMGKKVRLRQQVDPDLIGGMKLRVGDTLIDASVATQLRLMRERIVAAGRARGMAGVVEEAA